MRTVDLELPFSGQQDRWLRPARYKDARGALFTESASGLGGRLQFSRPQATIEDQVLVAHLQEVNAAPERTRQRVATQIGGDQAPVRLRSRQSRSNTSADRMPGFRGPLIKATSDSSPAASEIP